MRSFPFACFLIFALALTGCASAPNSTVQEKPNVNAELGMEAYLDGRYDMAEFYLTKVLTHLSPHEQHSPKTLPWRDTLANVYWETGRDSRLLTFARYMLPATEAALWTCKVDEREGYTSLARSCYVALHDEKDADRAERSAIIVETFAPDNVIFGVKPVSPP